MEKINDDANENNEDSKANDPFACFTVHIAKLK
jgi:hypothetical protein